MHTFSFRKKQTTYLSVLRLPWNHLSSHHPSFVPLLDLILPIYHLCRFLYLCTVPKIVSIPWESRNNDPLARRAPGSPISLTLRYLSDLQQVSHEQDSSIIYFTFVSFLFCTGGFVLLLHSSDYSQSTINYTLSNAPRQLVISECMYSKSIYLHVDLYH